MAKRVILQDAKTKEQLHPRTEVASVTGLQEAFEELDGKYINQNQINQANGVAGITRYGYISSSLIPVSSEIIEGSTMPVTSGAVYAAIQDFVTASVSNLINYYTKSQTYSKSEVDSLISSIKQFTYQSSDSLPTASASTMYKIYLIPAANSETNNAKDEYITVENESSYSWEKIGSTNIDLSGYYQKPASGIPASDLASGVIPDISGKADKSEMSIVAGTDENSDKTTITLKSGTSATVLTQHQDISGKQDVITTVNVNVDDNTGTPSGTASVSGNTFTLNLSNLKGAKGDTGAQGIQGIQGERGPKGDTGVTGDASSLAVIHGVDTTTSYAATDVAGADAVQDILKMLGTVYYVATT